MIKSLKNDPFDHGGMSLPFTPTKVSLDILDSCNKRLRSLAKDPPELFVHEDAYKFTENSMAILRQLADNVLKPSEELGMPFAEMVSQLQSSGKNRLNSKAVRKC